MKLICASNPKSRNGAVGRRLGDLREAFANDGVEVVMLDLTSDDFLRELEVALVADPDATVMGVGGDGTHFSLVNHLFDLLDSGKLERLPTYALCAMGTGNDVAKSIGLKVGARNLAAAVSVAVNGARVPCDLGRVDGQRFLDMFSAGWDVRVLQIRDRLTEWFAARPRLRRLVSGYLIYGIAALAATFGRGRWPMTLTVDGEEISGRFAGVLVNNGPVHAGEFILTPRARMTDGLLDVRVFRNRWTYMFAFVRGWRIWPKRLRGGGQGHRQCRTIRIASPGPLPTQIDGEQAGERQSIEVSVDPKALTLCVPTPKAGDL